MGEDTKVGVNREGRRVGESHHHAKLTDEQLETIRQLREAVNAEGKHPWSYGLLAKAFDTSKGHIHDIVSHRRRNQFVEKLKTVRVKPSNE